jgi:hypothetical protein
MVRSPIFAIGAQLARALLAGLLGSLIASILLAAMLFIIMAPPTFSIAGFAIAVTIAFTASLSYTIPSALLLATALTWPLRGWIARNPWPAALVYVAVGAVTGWAVIQFGFGGRMNSLAILGAGYGAATAIALVVILRKTRNWGDLVSPSTQGTGNGLGA